VGGFGWEDCGKTSVFRGNVRQDDAECEQPCSTVKGVESWFVCKNAVKNLLGFSWTDLWIFEKMKQRSIFAFVAVAVTIGRVAITLLSPFR
jgi:hypothetical protein